MPHVSLKRSRASLREARAPTMSKPNSSVHSFDSAQSEPSTPTWSLKGHARYPSSASSAGSSPPSAEAAELAASSARLSKLAEEPPEPEDDCIIVEGDSSELWQCLCESQPCVHTASADNHASMSPMSPIYFTADVGSEIASRTSSVTGRRGSIETNSIASRFTYRFSTMSRPWKSRKPVHPFATGYSTPTYDPSSRSSSLSSAPALEQQRDQLLELFAPSPVDPTASATFSVVPDTDNIPHATDPIDRATLAATPLLPPMIDEAKPTETPVQSPLQSPSIADSRTSMTFMTAATEESPQPQTTRSPPLSSKPSVASFRQARSGTLSSANDVPSFALPAPHDQWAIRLGHANFTVDPEPYVPNEFTAASIGRLFSDWERARCNFIKHQHRTGEHFGVTSKVYKLTEEKWTEIDAQWKRNYDVSVAEVTRTDASALLHTPVEPAPLMKIPSLNDAKAEGKFPKLGDEDIVGPMAQAAAPIPPANPSPRTGLLLKLLGSLKIPSNSYSSRTASGSRRTG